MSVSLKARRSIVYGGRRIAAGSPFDARTRSDARVLVAIGHAEARRPEAPSAPQSQQPTYRTRVMTADIQSQATQNPPLIAKGDELDELNAEALHAMAERLGVKVHHRAGALTLRRAIRESKQGASKE